MNIRYALYAVAIIWLGVVVAGIVLMLTNEWAWHPLGQCTPASQIPAIAHHEVIRCKSYNWYSGFAANFGELTLFTLLIGGWLTLWRTSKRLECAVEGYYDSNGEFVANSCHRLGHRIPGTAHYACSAHHPHGLVKGSGITPEDLLKQHKESQA